MYALEEPGKPRVLLINGSASSHSSNLRLIQFIAQSCSQWNVQILPDLKVIPHFCPETTLENSPKEVEQLRRKIQASDALIICTPEYVFSLPALLKNALEWCVSSTVFESKKVGIIVASASGIKAGEELRLLLTTLNAELNSDCDLLIQGARGKLQDSGEPSLPETREALQQFIAHFSAWIGNTSKN